MIWIDLWIGYWSNNSLNISSGEYIGYYALIAIGSGIFLFLRGLMFGIFSRTTAMNIFK
jgi:hypothetical protein